MKRVGRYEILDEIARGGMGAVYRAHDPSLEREVAIKFLLRGHAVARGRFQREAAALARLRHPNIVGVHDVGEHEGSPYLVLDLVEGHSLQERLNEKGTLRPAAAAQIARKLADALQHVHEEGVLHRDLKPANVVMDRQGEPRLTDFGLARGVDGSGSMTGEGTFVGTPGYWSPEQAHGDQSKIGPRTDVYGLGATLYALLTGEAPYEADDLVGVLAAMELPPIPPSQKVRMDRGLEAICLRCLEREPEARYPDARAVSQDLRRWLVSTPRVASRRSPVPWLAAFAVLLLAAIVLGTAVGMRARKRPPVTPPPTDVPTPPVEEPPPPPEAEAPALDPRALESLFEEGERRLRAGEFREAIRIYSQVVEQDPSSARGYFMRGNAYHLQELLEEALADYTRAIELDPDYAEAYATLGGLRSQQGNLRAGIADCTRALELNPKHLKAWHNRAIAHALRGDHLAAIRDCTSALEHYPQEAELVFYRAVSHKELRHTQPAIDDFTRTIQLEPNHLGAHIERGNLLAGQRRLKEALADFEEAVRIDPHDSRAFICRGNARFHLGQKADGIADLQHALKLLPPNDDRTRWVRERLAAMQR